ncbi:MAG: AAA family ATPase [Magnetococcus sp. DMHC-1]
MFLHSLEIRNLLSFGPDTEAIPLRPLNVLIGTNGSGKSNFLEAISLLQASPQDLSKPIRDAGGIEEWLWKPEGKNVVASVEAVIENPCNKESLLMHQLIFEEYRRGLGIVEEYIKDKDPVPGNLEIFPYFCLENRSAILTIGKINGSPVLKEIDLKSIDNEQSVLQQFVDIERYPEMTLLGKMYRNIKLYREWSIGRYASPRLYQDTDGRLSFLEEDFSNLGLILNGIKKNIEAKEMILKYLHNLNGDIKDFDVDIANGKVQVFLQEKSLSIPATRLSDGTLRFICLLAILCHPNPPPLVCIEEPEMGLHPDVIPALGDLLREASQRMQIIVTTHSNLLVDEFTYTPEDVIVFDKDNMQTRMRRLSQDELKAWLDVYSLGGGWVKGLCDGVR